MDNAQIMDTGSRPYRIMLADDFVLLRDCVKKYLGERLDLAVVGEAGNGLELLQLLESSDAPPDMIILDISMPVLDGLEVAQIVAKRWPQTKILILTLHEDKEHMQRAILAGAQGYLLKRDASEELFSAIDLIRQGGTYVSPVLPFSASL